MLYAYSKAFSVSFGHIKYERLRHAGQEECEPCQNAANNRFPLGRRQIVKIDEIK